jgi:hypothetical protein
MDPKLAFIVGVLGAAAPEIMRLYNLRTNPKFQWRASYFLMSLPFFLLGGIVALILPSTTYYGAFYAGLTAPVTINAVVKKAGELSEAGEVTPPEPKGIRRGVPRGGAPARPVEAAPSPARDFFDALF